MSEPIVAEIESHFAGAGLDASLLVAAGSIASPDAPFRIKGKDGGVPGEVIEAGRLAQPNNVDKKCVELGWISIDSDSGTVSVTEAGKALVDMMDDGIPSLVRARLEKWAEVQLKALLTGVEAPLRFSELNATGQWIVTHGLWLVCSSESGERSHRGSPTT